MKDGAEKPYAGRSFHLAMVLAIVSVLSLVGTFIVQWGSFSFLWRWVLTGMLCLVLFLLAIIAGASQLLGRLRNRFREARFRSTLKRRKALLKKLAERIESLIDPKSLYSVSHVIRMLSADRESDMALRIGVFHLNVLQDWVSFFVGRAGRNCVDSDGLSMSLFFREAAKIMEEIATLSKRCEDAINQGPLPSEQGTEEMVTALVRNFWQKFRPLYNLCLDDLMRAHKDFAKIIPDLAPLQLGYL